MSHYEQYQIIRPYLANTEQELVNKSPLLIDTALEVFPAFVENSYGKPGVEIAPYDPDIRVGMELEGGYFFAQGPNPQAADQRPVVKTLLATKRPYEAYDVVKNTYSLVDKRLGLCTHLFRVATPDLNPDQLFSDDAGPLPTRTHQAGWSVLQFKGSSEVTCVVAPLGSTTDEAHLISLRPSEKRMRPFSTHRIANYRQREAIDFMAGHAGLSG